MFKKNYNSKIKRKIIITYKHEIYNLRLYKVCCDNNHALNNTFNSKDNNWVMMMTHDEELQEMAKQLLNNLIEKFGVRNTRKYASYPQIRKESGWSYAIIPLNVKPEGIERVYDYANKFIKDVKDEDLITLEEYFVKEFRNNIGYLKFSIILRNILTGYYSFDTVIDKVIFKKILEEVGDNYYRKTDLNLETIEEIREVVLKDCMFKDHNPFAFYD